ncbi:MAG: transcription antitermination factor NusB [Thermomicrobiales bacterium]|nr:transcription antitermination factor NusB [Thermomicrobiales bacterium]
MSDQEHPTGDHGPSGKPGRRKKQNPRRQGRTLALQVLYETDQTQHPWPEVLDRTIEANESSSESANYARQLVEGIFQHQRSIDREIGLAAPAFPIEQLSPVDRNALRIAIFELRYTDVPVKVAINEAVELAKRFGGESSGRFVNGVLGTVVDRLPDSDTKRR